MFNHDILLDLVADSDLECLNCPCNGASLSPSRTGSEYIQLEDYDFIY